MVKLNTFYSFMVLVKTNNNSFIDIKYPNDCETKKYYLTIK